MTPRGAPCRPGRPESGARSTTHDRTSAFPQVGRLRRYSLISPAVDGQVSVHRLVQAVTVDQMSAKSAEAWRRAAAAVIEAALPSDPEQPDAWPDFSALPHAQAALTTDSGGMWRVVQYLGDSGKSRSRP